MKLNIVIPTLGRTEKLLNAVGSIAQAITLIPDERVFLYIYYSNKEDFDKDTIGFLKYPWIFTRLLEEPYNVGTFWNKHIKENIFDIMIYLNDDVILEIQCLKKIVEIFNTKFQDLDGIVGIRQKNIPSSQALQTAFGAIGVAYTERFPDKKVFPFMYKRFYGDKEIFEYSTKINKLYFSEDGPELIHLHPAFTKENVDNTHVSVRKYLKDDRLLYEKRHKENKLWGETYD
jgi:hypothetical protein